MSVSMQATGEERATALFSPGRLRATPGVRELLAKLHDSDGAAIYTAMVNLLSRHCRGDWAEMSADDRALNQQAAQDGGRVFSQFTLKNTPGFPDGRVWVITDADRRETTLLLPDEY